MQKFNNWNVPYSTISFFENAIRAHGRVKKVNRERDIFFRIERDNNSVLNVLLLNEYRFGLASLIRALEEFPETKFIIIGGNWNESTYEANIYAENNNIGIYNFSEFLGAINYNKVPLRYIKKNERNNRKNTFRGA